MEKSAGVKTGKIKGKQFRNKNIKTYDDCFNTNRVNEKMFNAQYAKFTKNKDLSNLLIATKMLNYFIILEVLVIFCLKIFIWFAILFKVGYKITF